MDGTIDIIATDHAPHSKEEKAGGMVDSPFGIVGSETAFSLLYTHLVEKGIVSLAQLIGWMAYKPARLFHLDGGTIEVGQKADLAFFDLSTPKEIIAEDFLSLATNTPFVGWSVKGTTTMTFVDGKLVYQEGSVQ